MFSKCGVKRAYSFGNRRPFHVNSVSFMGYCRHVLFEPISRFQAVIFEEIPGLNVNFDMARLEVPKL